MRRKNETLIGLERDVRDFGSGDANGEENTEKMLKIRVKI